MVSIITPKVEKTYLGSGSQLIDNIESLDRFDAYALPSSPTYRSLTHYESASIVKDLMIGQGINISAELFAISRSYHQMYGSFTIDYSDYFDDVISDKNLKPMIIVRNSIDKSMSFKVSVGIVNMICSNGIMSSSIFADAKGSHTKNADPIGTASQVINNYLPTFEKLTDKLDNLKSNYLTDYEGRKRLMTCCKLACFPSSEIMNIWDEYNKPSFSEFDERTEYNLLMAITHKLKDVKTLSTLMGHYKQTADAFGL